MYGLGSITLKAIGFFLLPLYTRYLTPADYGIMAVTATLMAILGIIYPLSLHGAVTRFYFTAQTETERRQTNGTLWLAIIVVALGITLLLDRFGAAIFSRLFEEVPFEPYIRLTIWIAFLNTLSLLPLVFFQVQERPVPYVMTTVTKTLLTIGLVIYFVVFQQQGVYGYLKGMFGAQALLAIPYLMLTLRQIELKLQWDILKAALLFSLPLIPHNLAGWVLELSDRAILERFVSLDQLGLYSIGYQFGLLMTLVATAVNYAWVPFLYKKDAQQGEAAKPVLTRLATYYTLGFCLAGLALMLLVREVIMLMTAPPFHAADRVAPWIIGGLLFSGLYYIPVNFLFLRRRTGLVPVVTVLSGLVNVGLNLWLAPVYGIMAAAWSTCLAYAVMLGLVWWLARRVYPFPYEYRRLGLIALTTAGLLAVGLIPNYGSFGVTLGVKLGLLLAYPVVLLALGFFTPAEKEQLFAFARQGWGALRRLGGPTGV